MVGDANDDEVDESEARRDGDAGEVDDDDDLDDIYEDPPWYHHTLDVLSLDPPTEPFSWSERVVVSERDGAQLSQVPGFEIQRFLVRPFAYGLRVQWPYLDPQGVEGTTDRMSKHLPGIWTWDLDRRIQITAALRGEHIAEAALRMAVVARDPLALNFIEGAAKSDVVIWSNKPVPVRARVRQLLRDWFVATEVNDEQIAIAKMFVVMEDFGARQLVRDSSAAADLVDVVRALEAITPLNPPF